MTARGPEVRASNAQAAASIANADNISQYKKRMFYRRLKVILIGTTALALLLAGCLLGFVLPATIHEKPSVGANDSSRVDPSSDPGRHVGLNNSTLRVNKTDINITAPIPSTKPLEMTPISSSVLSTRFTTASSLPDPTPRPTTKMTTKWWVVKIHDQLSEVKRKHAQYRGTNAPLPKRQTVTPIQMTTSDSPVNKWWLLHWREHVENALLKNNKKNNNTAIVTPRMSAMLADSNTGTDDVTLPPIEDVKNNLPALKLQNQTSNVRRVTSYPKSNITTTQPSVVTRKV